MESILRGTLWRAYCEAPYCGYEMNLKCIKPVCFCSPWLPPHLGSLSSKFGARNLFDFFPYSHVLLVTWSRQWRGTMELWDGLVNLIKTKRRADGASKRNNYQGIHATTEPVWVVLPPLAAAVLGLAAHGT